MKILVHASIYILGFVFLFGEYQQEKSYITWQVYVVELFKKLKPFFKVVPFDIMASRIGEFQFLHMLHNIWYNQSLILGINIDVQWYLIIVLICISITNNVKIFYAFIFHTYIFFGKVLVQIFCPYFNGLFVFSLDFESSLYIMDIFYQIYAI